MEERLTLDQKVVSSSLTSPATTVERSGVASA